MIARHFQLAFIRGNLHQTHLGCALWPKFLNNSRAGKSESALYMMSGNEVNDLAYAFFSREQQQHDDDYIIMLVDFFTSIRRWRGNRELIFPAIVCKIKFDLINLRERQKKKVII